MLTFPSIIIVFLMGNTLLKKIPKIRNLSFDKTESYSNLNQYLQL